MVHFYIINSTYLFLFSHRCPNFVLKTKVLMLLYLNKLISLRIFIFLIVKQQPFEPNMQRYGFSLYLVCRSLNPIQLKSMSLYSSQPGRSLFRNFDLYFTDTSAAKVQRVDQRLKILFW